MPRELRKGRFAHPFADGANTLWCIKLLSMQRRCALAQRSLQNRPKDTLRTDCLKGAIPADPAKILAQYLAQDSVQEHA